MYRGHAAQMQKRLHCFTIKRLEVTVPRGEVKFTYTLQNLQNITFNKIRDMIKKICFYSIYCPYSNELFYIAEV